MKPYQVITDIISFDNNHSKFAETREVSYYEDLNTAVSWYTAQKDIAEAHAGVKSYGKAVIYVRLEKVTPDVGMTIYAATFGL